MDFNVISYFQLDNLVRTRTHFIFINYAEDISSWFGPLEKIHLRNFQRNWPPNDVVTELQNMKAPLEQAIVVLCQDGHKSKELVNQLTSSGYLNVYYVDNGYEGLLKEKGVGSST
ncbi:MAG: rhodanese-like domain-containing protein [Bdellovibrionia bacterium]